MADPTTGLRIVGSELMLNPGPGGVDYPSEVLGTTVETSDGVAIQQMPANDPRKRSWIWYKYRQYMPEYVKLYALLTSLRSQTRFSQGLSPFVYLLENQTDQFVSIQNASFNATAGAASTITTGSALTVDQYKNGELEITAGTGVGQIRNITTNSTSVFTVSAPWTVIPTNTSVFRVRWRSSDWFKCRVLDVNRKMDDNSMSPAYEFTKLVFSVQDPTWNLL